MQSYQAFPRVVYLAIFTLHQRHRHICKSKLTSRICWRHQVLLAHSYCIWLQCPQEDITALLTWSRESDLDFNLDKFVLLSFKCKLETTYTTSDTAIPHNNSHKDLGLILSDNLSWEKHYKSISAHAYKVLGFIRHTVAPTHSTTTLVKLCCRYY